MSLTTAIIFGDNMVLQRNKPIAVWGEAVNSSTVTVEIADQKVETSVQNGNWKVTIPPLEACADTGMYIIDDAGNKLTYKHVAIGEVWIAGGQSNMEMSMYADAEYEEVLLDADNPMIRFYDQPHVSYEGQLDDEDFSDAGFWRCLSQQDLQYFSAAGYYFAELLHGKLDIPVGIVGCNWGGSPAAAWVDESYLTGELECYIQDNRDALENLDQEEYAANFKAERARMNSPEAKKAMSDMMRRPVLKPMTFDFHMDEDKRLEYMNGPYSPFRSCGLYNTMLKKIMPYTVAGVIWYQGEADVDRAAIYDKMFGDMIRCWRDGWGEEFPFLFVQLAPLEKFAISSGDTFIPIRQMQDKVSKTVPNTYMACIMDVGMKYDIHPKQKRPVGERLALLALGKVYGYDLLCESPEAVKAEKVDGRVTISFDYSEGGLSVSEGPINALELHIDGKLVSGFVETVSGTQLIIEYPEIKSGSAIEVRYAWVGFCVANLYNVAGLPAKPFIITV